MSSQSDGYCYWGEDRPLHISPTVETLKDMARDVGEAAGHDEWATEADCPGCRAEAEALRQFEKLRCAHERQRAGEAK